jgi:hypothetical protein
VLLSAEWTKSERLTPKDLRGGAIVSAAFEAAANVQQKRLRIE